MPLWLIALCVVSGIAIGSAILVAFIEGNRLIKRK